MKKGVIFDLDGTLVDSIPFHFRIHQQVLQDAVGYHLTKEYFFAHCNGKSAYEFYADILKLEGHDLSVLEKMKKLDKKYLKHQLKHKVKVFPYVKGMLKALKKQGVKIAVATSSKANYAKIVLQKNNIEEYFDAVLSRDDVVQSKPNPKIFLLARQQLGIPKKDCVVVEDAINGFKAAKRAKIDCIGLTTSLTPKQIKESTPYVANHTSLLRVLEKL